MFSECGTVLFVPTARELSKIFKLSETFNTNGFEFAFFKEIPIIVTGIGKTNASITATAFFAKYRPCRAILIGICGAYRASGIRIGETVSVTEDHFVDEGSYDGYKIVSLAEKGMQICGKGDAVPFNYLNGFRKAVSNTVSLIPAENGLSEIYRAKTNADVENMEGAAFGLAALKAGINAFQLRAVSNYCGAQPEWNIIKASSAMCAAVESVL